MKDKQSGDAKCPMWLSVMRTLPSGFAKDQKLDKLKLMGVAARMLPGMTVLEFAGLIKEWERRGFSNGRCVSELIIGAGELAQLRREARGEP